LLATATPASAPLDIFTGTLANEHGAAMLTRCDLVENRYHLREAAVIFPRLHGHR
jgi:hypothetical protein